MRRLSLSLLMDSFQFTHEIRVRRLQCDRLNVVVGALDSQEFYTIAISVFACAEWVLEWNTLVAVATMTRIVRNQIWCLCNSLTPILIDTYFMLCCNALTICEIECHMQRVLCIRNQFSVEHPQPPAILMRLPHFGFVERVPFELPKRESASHVTMHVCRRLVRRHTENEDGWLILFP